MQKYPDDVSGGGRSTPGPPAPGVDTPKGDTTTTVAPFDYTTPAFDFQPINYMPGPVPQFKAPQFTAPDAVTMMNDPGYQFRLSQGEQALQQSAAAKGLLRTGGTLKDILGYGQNFASSEYQNVFDRALQNYQQHYQAAKDMYAPNLLQWQTLASIGEQNALANFNRQYDMYTFGLNNELAHEKLVADLASSAGA